MYRLSRAGFTLLELLVTLALIAVLIGLLLSAVQYLREAANRAICQSHLREIGLAIHNYHHTHGFLPPNRIEDGWATWAALILPQVEQDSVFSQWDISRRYHEQPDGARLYNCPLYFCPSRRTPGQVSEGTVDRRLLPPEFPHVPGGLADYAACAGNGTGGYEVGKANGAMIRGIARRSARITTRGMHVVSWRGRLTLNDISDGTSVTLLVGEKYVPADQYGRSIADASVYNGDHTLGPHSCLAGRQVRKNGEFIDRPLAARNSLPDPTRIGQSFGSEHAGLCNFAIADGSVRAIQNSIDLEVLSRLAARNDGLHVPDF